MEEYRASVAGDPRAPIVIDFDNQIIEMVLADKAVPGIAGRQFDALVIAPVGRVLAPGVVRRNPPHGEPCRGLWPPFGVPPDADEAETPTRRRAVAFPLVCQNTAAAERDRKNLRSGNEQPAAARGGCGADPERL